MLSILIYSILSNENKNIAVGNDIQVINLVRISKIGLGFVFCFSILQI